MSTEVKIHVQKVCTINEFERLEKVWNTLLSDSASNNFFLRWEWLAAWWESYREPSCNLCILLVFRDGDLIGIGPFYLSRVFPNIRRLKFLGTKQGSITSEYMDIIYRDSDAYEVLKEIMEYIENENLCEDIALYMVGDSSKTSDIVRHLSLKMKYFYDDNDRFETPYISLPDTYEKFLSMRSASMRRTIIKNLKKLEKYPAVSFRVSREVSEYENDFNEFVRLHQSRWESRKMPGAFAQKCFKEFQKGVMRIMRDNGNLELCFLNVDGRNIGVLYNISYNNKIYFYQSGLDPSFDHNLSPGVLLHSYCIERAISLGLTEYDFLVLGKMDGYKKRWTSEFRYQQNLYLAKPAFLKLLMSARNKARLPYAVFKNLYRSLAH